MIIRSLSLKNFQSIEKADLTFDKGIIVLYGENGHGKSSVFNAIAFCISEYRKGSSWGDYIRKGEKDMEIHMVLQMTEDPKDIMVFDYSGISEPSETLTKVVSYKGRTYSSNSEVSDFLSSYFDQSMLENVVFSLQESQPIAKLKPSETRDIFKKVFNSEFPDIVESIRDELETKKNEEKTLQAHVDALTNKIYNFFDIDKVDISRLNELEQELKSSQEQEIIKIKLSALAEKTKEIAKKNEKISKLEEDKIVANLDLATSLQDIDTLKDKLAQAEQGDLEPLKKELEYANNALKEQNDILDVFSNSFSVKDVQKEIDDFSETIDSRIQKGFEMEAEEIASISVLRKHIDAHKKGVCETCGQKTDIDSVQNFENQMGSLETKIQKIKDKIQNLKQEKIVFTQTKKQDIDSYNKTLIEKQKVVKEYQDKITPIKYKILQQEQIPKTIQANIDGALELIKVKHNSIEKISQDIKYLEEDVKSIQLWCTQNQVEHNLETTRESKEIQNEIKDINSKVEANKQKLILNKKLEDEQIEDQTKIKDFNEKLNRVSLRLKELKTLQKIFDTEFPNFINIKACAILESYMNSVFANIKPEFEVKVVQDKKGISLTYRAKKDSSFIPAYMCSGFETALMSMAFRVSISTAYGMDFPLLLDEVDGPASEESSGKVFQRLSDIDGFPQIFVISHRPSAISILKENGAVVWNVVNGNFIRMET